MFGDNRTLNQVPGLSHWSTQATSSKHSDWWTVSKWRCLHVSGPKLALRQQNKKKNLQKWLKNLDNLEGKYSSGNRPSRVSREMHC